ncbi:MAG TPA: glycosyltransferase family 4 protein [Pyrinomonadaceae bacterium]|nr:glycosyltransferase family 4 protein [Pyrinomonadaceae bacterium]
MKILFYNHTGTVSGAERVLMMILGGLDRDAYESVVVCPAASGMMALAHSANIRTLGLSQLEARFTWRIDRIFKYLASFAGVIGQARRIIKEEHPDLIHANSIRAGLVMSIATIGLDAPVVWHGHDVLPLHPLSTLVRLVALLTSRNHILAVSHAVASGFRGILLQPFRRRVPITVIHNSVDLDRFQPNKAVRKEARSALRLSENQPVIGIVGQLTPRKGQLELVRAFARVAQKTPDAVLLIVGEALFNRDEEYASQIANAVKSLGLTNRVRLLGARDDVPELIQALDVLVVNSYQEPFALTVLEGLASGVTVLATAVGGTPEMIQHNVNGWLVKSRDQNELESGLTSLSSDNALRARLGSRARLDAIAQYSIPRYLTEMNSLYRHILSRGKTPHAKNVRGFAVKLSAD